MGYFVCGGILPVCTAIVLSLLIFSSSTWAAQHDNQDKRAQVQYQQSGLPRMRFGRSMGVAEEANGVKRPEWSDIGWVWGKKKRDIFGKWKARPGRPGFVEKKPDWNDLGWTWGRK